MKNNMADENKQIPIEVPADKCGGIYSNLAIITHSSTEFIVDFAAMLPAMPKAIVESRIIMTPENAKKLLLALTENVNKYESQFGPIKLGGPNAGGKTFPMGGFGGNNGGTKS